MAAWLSARSASRTNAKSRGYSSRSARTPSSTASTRQRWSRSPTSSRKRTTVSRSCASGNRPPSRRGERRRRDRPRSGRRRSGRRITPTMTSSLMRTWLARATRTATRTGRMTLCNVQLKEHDAVYVSISSGAQVYYQNQSWTDYFNSLLISNQVFCRYKGIQVITSRFSKQIPKRTRQVPRRQDPPPSTANADPKAAAHAHFVETVREAPQLGGCFQPDGAGRSPFADGAA